MQLIRDRQWAILIGVLLFLDALAICGSLSLAYDVRIASGLLAYSSTPDPVAYRWFTLASIPVWLIIFALRGLYHRDNLLGGLHEYQQVLGACTYGIVVGIIATFFWRNEVQLSRGWLLLAWGLSCCLLVAERFCVRRIAYLLRRRGWLTERVLIVGANDQGSAIARQWLCNPTSGMSVVGFADDFKPIGASVTAGIRVIGRASELDELAHRTAAREVVVISNAVAWETFEKVVGRSLSRNGYTIRLSPGFYETLASGVAITNKTFVPLFTVAEARLVGIDALLKLALDFGLGLMLACLASPLLIGIAAALRLTSSDPVLDHLPTMGQGSRVYTMLKFHIQRGEAPGPLARFLTRSGLDKLPQLLNVLAGQMSLVGPRPRVFGGDADDPCTAYNFRTVKPGIIGPWLVTASWVAGNETQDELYYVRNWTIWLDLQILIQTVLSLITSALHPPARRRLKSDFPPARV